MLDLGLPDMDGLDVIERLRHGGSAVPIVVLSARTDETGKVRALDLGADDYVTKPFGMDESLARIRAALRHRLQQDGEKPVFKSGDLTVDLVRRIVTVRGQEVKLTPREYDLLRLLAAACRQGPDPSIYPEGGVGRADRRAISAHLHPDAAPENRSRSATAFAHPD